MPELRANESASGGGGGGAASAVVKRVVSVSLGSSRRDKITTARFADQTFEIQRIGTDGDTARFRQLLEELDGRVDAIGLGGLDRYLWAGGRRYEMASARQLIRGVRRTPVVDGSGLKDSLERETVRWLAENGVVDFAHRNTLMVCGVDRFGMAEALAEQRGPILFGDLMFNLGVPLAIPSWSAHRRLARLLLPVLTRLPIALLYPTGQKQNEITPKWERYYRWADVIAGDFLLIGRFLPGAGAGAPAPLAGKTILTNTTRPADVEELEKRGVSLLVTTTPEFEGGSFGTNVMEGVLIALNGGQKLSPEGYLATLKQLGWTPNVRRLRGSGKSEKESRACNDSPS